MWLLFDLIGRDLTLRSWLIGSKYVLFRSIAAYLVDLFAESVLANLVQQHLLA